MRGLSMDALSDKLDRLITKQSISKYETGKMMPDSSCLIAIARALDVSVDYLFRPITFSVDHIEFRKKANLGMKKVQSIKAEIRGKIERYLEIESLYDMPVENDIRFSNVLVEGEKDVFPIAEEIKKKWLVGEDGINNLIEILEDNQIKVIEIDADPSFDGLSGYINGKIPFIVLNANFPSERKRFTALHELGHLVLNFAESVDRKTIERLCNLFASEMLISKEIFIRKLGANRSDISLKELIDIQKQFGISIDALMYKAQQLNIITDQRYTTYCKKKNFMPDFRALVDENRTKEEASGRFERLVYRALADEIISISKAGVLLDKSINEVREELALV